MQKHIFSLEKNLSFKEIGLTCSATYLKYVLAVKSLNVSWREADLNLVDTFAGLYRTLHTPIGFGLACYFTAENCVSDPAALFYYTVKENNLNFLKYLHEQYREEIDRKLIDFANSYDYVLKQQNLPLLAYMIRNQFYSSEYIDMKIIKQENLAALKVLESTDPCATYNNLYLAIRLRKEKIIRHLLASASCFATNLPYIMLDVCKFATVAILLLFLEHGAHLPDDASEICLRYNNTDLYSYLLHG